MMTECGNWEIYILSRLAVFFEKHVQLLAQRILEKLSSIEDWGQTDRVTVTGLSLTLTYDPDFRYQPESWPIRTKSQVERSVGSKMKWKNRTDRQTDGRRDATDCFTLSANAVG